MRKIVCVNYAHFPKSGHICKYKLGYYVADYVNLNTKMISYINLVFIIVQPRPSDLTIAAEMSASLIMLQ